jgi:hypothetical protein
LRNIDLTVVLVFGPPTADGKAVHGPVSASAYARRMQSPLVMRKVQIVATEWVLHPRGKTEQKTGLAVTRAKG